MTVHAASTQQFIYLTKTVTCPIITLSPGTKRNYSQLRDLRYQTTQLERVAASGLTRTCTLFTPTREVRHSMRRLSQNSQVIGGITSRSEFCPNRAINVKRTDRNSFTPRMGREMLKVGTKLDLRPWLKFGFHWNDFYRTHNCPAALLLLLQLLLLLLLLLHWVEYFFRS